MHFITESWKDNNIFDYITTNITYTSKETIASSMYYQLAIGITIGVVTLGVILVSGNYINAKTFFDQYNKRIYIENKPTLEQQKEKEEESTDESDQELSQESADESDQELSQESTDESDQELSQESTDESDQELSEESTDESDQEEPEILSEESDQESDQIEAVNQETLVFSINTEKL